MSTRLRKLGIAALSLALTLLAAEFVVRQLVENPITSIAETRIGWGAHGFRADELVEYSFAPGVESRMTLPGDYDVPFRINAQGLRDDVEHAPEHPDTTRVLLIGDSYVFGVGVEFGDTIGEQLERALAVPPLLGGRPTEVVAVGCPSYGLDSYAKLIERWAPRLHPDVIVVAIFPGNDLIDYEVKARDPKAVVESYIVSAREAWSYQLRKVSTLAHLALEHLNPHPRILAHRPDDPTDADLRRMLETMTPWIARTVEAAAAGSGDGAPIPLAVTLMHGRYSVQAWRDGRLGFGVPPITGVVAEFERLGVPVLDPKPAWIAADRPAERYYHRKDGHYSADGSALVARYLADALRRTFGDALR